MNAANWVSVFAAVVAAGAAVVAASAARQLRRGARDLALALRRLESEAGATLSQAHAVIGHASGELARVEEVLGSAGAVTATVASASRLAERVFTNPLVKIVAFGAGVGGGARRLVGDGGTGPNGSTGRNASTRRNGERVHGRPAVAPDHGGGRRTSGSWR